MEDRTKKNFPSFKYKMFSQFGYPKRWDFYVYFPSSDVISRRNPIRINQPNIKSSTISCFFRLLQSIFNGFSDLRGQSWILLHCRFPKQWRKKQTGLPSSFVALTWIRSILPLWKWWLLYPAGYDIWFWWVFLANNSFWVQAHQFLTVKMTYYYSWSWSWKEYHIHSSFSIDG